MFGLKSLLIRCNVLFFVVGVSLTANASKTLLVGHAANFSNVSRSAINPYNNSVSNGLNFAVSEYREKLKARGLEIKIQDFDYGSSEILALNVAKDVVASPAIATIGFYESGQSLLGSPVLAKAGLPLISPMSSATRLFGQDAHFHPMSFSNESMGKALANFAKKNFKAKTALVIPAADCAYCADLGGSFIDAAKGLGITTTKADVLNDESNFASVESAIKGKTYDVIVVPNHELTSAKIVAYLLKRGIKTPYLGGDGWGNAQGNGFYQIVTDKEFEGYCVGHWHPDLSTETGKKFVKDWKKTYGNIPSADSAIAYDSMRLLIFAILKTTDFTRSGIQKSLESIKTYDGASGNLRFTGHGQAPEKALVILKSDMIKKSFIPARWFNPKD